MLFAYLFTLTQCLRSCLCLFLILSVCVGRRTPPLPYMISESHNLTSWMSRFQEGEQRRISVACTSARHNDLNNRRRAPRPARVKDKSQLIQKTGIKRKIHHLPGIVFLKGKIIPCGAYQLDLPAPNASWNELCAYRLNPADHTVDVNRSTKEYSIYNCDYRSSHYYRY